MSSAERPGYHLPPGTLAPVDIDLDQKCMTRSAGASIGKKYLMAAAGLFWCFFVLMHLVGNFQLFLGADAYNAYSDFLVSLGKILYAMEIVLVVALLGHAVLGVVVSLQNSAAKRNTFRTELNSTAATHPNNASTAKWPPLVNNAK